MAKYTTYKKNGITATKNPRQKNLPLDTQYKIIDTWYSSIEDGGGDTCDNCGRVISNCAKVQDREGRKHTVGMDCAKTLTGITDTFELSNAEAGFQAGKSARATILKFIKTRPYAIVRAETFNDTRNYYKEVGAGSWYLDNPQRYGDKNWKQYPARHWAVVYPMIKSLVTT